MNAENRSMETEARLRESIDAWAKAVRNRDLPAILAHYAPDVVAFDAVGPLRFVGRESYADHWRGCMTMCPGEMIFELRDVQVVVAGDHAYACWLCRCGTTDGKEEQCAWMRATAVWRRSEEGWRIVHEHSSAPFNPETGKAVFDLVP
jgi:uncharacterized protein (TIGR02246 family)